MPAEQMQEASTHELSGQKTLVRSAYLTRPDGCFVVLGIDQFLLEWNNVKLGWFCLHYLLLIWNLAHVLPAASARLDYSRHPKYVSPNLSKRNKRQM